MQAQDRQEKERADARNALEEYVYELRGKLSEGEALHDFIADEPRARLVAQLDALEQWLYDEGEDQHRQVRTARHCTHSQQACLVVSDSTKLIFFSRPCSVRRSTLPITVLVTA